MAKKQKIKSGLVLKIATGDGFKSFAKVLKDSRICIYNFRIKEEDFINFNLNVLENKPILFYVSIYDSVIVEGKFPVIGELPVSIEEIHKIPPRFNQDENTLECTLYYYEPAIIRKATPEECIGLDPVCIYGPDNIIERIVNHYAGKKTPFIESHKVILSKDDVRYNNPFVQWDFEKEEWVKGNQEEHKAVVDKYFESKSRRDSYVDIVKDEELITICFYIEEEEIMQIGEKMNEINEAAYMNGYNWDAFLRYYLSKFYPELLEGMESDPEAGMYVATYTYSTKNKKKAKEFKTIIQNLIEYKENLFEIVRKEGTQINWD